MEVQLSKILLTTLISMWKISPQATFFDEARGKKQFGSNRHVVCMDLPQTASQNFCHSTLFFTLGKKKFFFLQTFNRDLTSTYQIEYYLVIVAWCLSEMLDSLESVMLIIYLLVEFLYNECSIFDYQYITLKSMRAHSQIFISYSHVISALMIDPGSQQ